MKKYFGRKTILSKKKASLWRRISRVCLAIIMIIGIAMPMAYAEEVKTPIEKDASTLGQLEIELGVDFSIENIQKAGVKDANFAKAIYDSIHADANNFTIVEAKKERLASSREIKEAGEKEGIEGIECILAYFAGDINASNQQIEEIDGIRLLRQASLIDVSSNHIESLMPLSVGEIDESELWSDKFALYFGSYGRNTEIKVSKNSIFHYPTHMGGRITLLDESYFTLTDISLGEEWLSDLLEDDVSRGISIPEFEAPIFCNNKPAILSGRGVNLYIEGDIDESELKVVNKYASQPVGPILLEGTVKKTGTVLVIIPTGLRMVYMTASEGNNLITEQSTTFKWDKVFNIQLYTKVTAESQTKGKVTVSKVDKVERNGLSNAEFTLYQKDENGLEQIKTVKVTDENGLAVFDELEPGHYVVKETKEPEGYKELTSEEREAQKKEFTVTDGSSIQITSNTPNPITVNNGTGDRELEKLENGAYIASGNSKENIQLDVNEVGNSQLRDIKVEWTKGEDGKDGSEVFTSQEEALKKIKEMTIKRYKNTKVTATFESRDENGEELVFEVENESKSGTLAISKKVENPNGVEFNPETLFSFQVNFIKDGRVLEGKYPYQMYKSDTGEVIGDKKEIQSGERIEIKDGEEVIIDKLPIGTKFHVIEEEYEDYETSGRVMVADNNKEKTDFIKGREFEGEISWNELIQVEVKNKIEPQKEEPDTEDKEEPEHPGAEDKEDPKPEDKQESDKPKPGDKGYPEKPEDNPDKSIQTGDKTNIVVIVSMLILTGVTIMIEKYMRSQKIDKEE